MKRWIVMAGTTLVLLLTSITTLLWSEAKQRDVLSSTRENLQDGLQSLVIQRTGKADIKLRVQEDRWQIHHPCIINVNQSRLEPLLSIVSPAAFSYAAAEVDLEAAGLINPIATIIANNQRIDIGKTDLSGERRYIKRGDRVEFAPEWIASLLDGGLSALSALELFNDDITSVKVDALSQTQDDLNADTQIWQQLSAQQIVPWPLSDNEPQSAQYAVTIQSKAGERRLEAFTTPAYTAIVFEEARCAYLLPNDALSPS